jgi:Ca-activated chloride channel family protein
MKENSKEKSREEDQPSSGSGAGSESKSKEKQKETKLISDGNKEQQPLGSKVYDLINKGYIRETQPW